MNNEKLTRKDALDSNVKKQCEKLASAIQNANARKEIDKKIDQGPITVIGGWRLDKK